MNFLFVSRKQSKTFGLAGWRALSPGVREGTFGTDVQEYSSVG